MVHPCFSVDPIPFDGRAHILTSEEIKKSEPRFQPGKRRSDYVDMAPQVGLEPTTLRLTAECSAIELLRNVFVP